MLNLDEIRKNIILKPGVHYFDFAASGLAYEPVEREIADVLKTYANTHSDSSLSAIITQRRYEGARESLKKLLGLDERTGCDSRDQEISGVAWHLPAACNQKRDRRGKFTRRAASARARFAVRTPLKRA